MTLLKFLYIGATFILLTPVLLLGWLGAEIHMTMRIGYRRCLQFYANMEKQK